MIQIKSKAEKNLIIPDIVRGYLVKNKLYEIGATTYTKQDKLIWRKAEKEGKVKERNH
jgi:hypothetical protein